MKRYWRLFFIVIFVSLILTGCWDQKIYERIGFVLQVGIESSEDRRLTISYTSPVTDPRKREEVELVSIDVGLIREFREEAKGLSPKAPEGGKLQQIVISDSLAEKGIKNLLEIFEREPTNPGIAYVVISEISPKQLFNFMQKLGDKPRPSFYLDQLIENNYNTANSPNTSVFDFGVQEFAPGIDPIAPIVKIKDEDGRGVKIDGSALFSGDKMVGKINTKQTSVLLAMKGKMKRTEYIFTSTGPPQNDITGKTGTAILLHSPKKKVDVKIVDNIPKVKISLKFKGDYDEREWDTIDKKDKQKELEKLISEELKDECIRLLKYTQEVGSDPIGIGDMVRAKYYPYWKEHKWEEIYKGVQFDVEASIDIVRYGIIK